MYWTQARIAVMIMRHLARGGQGDPALLVRVVAASQMQARYDVLPDRPLAGMSASALLMVSRRLSALMVSVVDGDR
jgi:hypothetical protein